MSPRRRKQHSKRIVLSGQEQPRTKKEVKFCEQYIKHRDPNKAALEAGYSKSTIAKTSKHLALLNRFNAYISARLETREKAIAERYALSQEMIIEEMRAIAFANPLDYIKIEEREITVSKNGEKKRTEIRKFAVRKDITELTRSQAAAISNVKVMIDGSVVYDLPDQYVKYPYLKDLGKHLGLFHSKLIQEHRFRQGVKEIDLSTLPTDELVKMESMLLSVMTEEERKSLGIYEGDFMDITPKE